MDSNSHSEGEPTMGRKKSEPVLIPEPEPEPERKKGWKSQEVRRIAAENPGMKQGEIARYFEQEFGESISIAQISMALGKSSHGPEPTPQGRGVNGAEPSIHDLVQVVKKIESKDGLDGFLKLYEDVKEIIQAAGSMERLEKILEAARELKQ